MATETEVVQIQFRQGVKADLVASALIPGEPVYSTDTKEIGVALIDGTIMWMATLNASGRLNQMPAAADVGAIATTAKGAASGVAGLGTDGIVPYAQLQSSGTWTPTLYGATTAGAPAYIIRYGHYTKFGKLIMCSFSITISERGGILGRVYISGLPVPVQSGGQNIEIPISAFNVSASSVASIVARLYPGQSNFAVEVNMSSGGQTDLTETNLTPTSVFRGVLIYPID